MISSTLFESFLMKMDHLKRHCLVMTILWMMTIDIKELHIHLAGPLKNENPNKFIYSNQTNLIFWQEVDY